MYQLNFAALSLSDHRTILHVVPVDTIWNLHSTEPTLGHTDLIY